MSYQFDDQFDDLYDMTPRPIARERTGPNPVSPVNHAGSRDTRFPNMRGTPPGFRPARTVNHSTPDLVKMLIDGYRVQVVGQRRQEDKLIQDNRKTQDELFQHIQEAIHGLGTNTPQRDTPNLLDCNSFSLAQEQRMPTDCVDAEEWYETIERDSVLGTQEPPIERQDLSLMGRMENSSVPDISTRSAEDDQIPPGFWGSEGDAIRREELPHAQTNPASLPNPTESTTRRGYKRKRASRIEKASAGASSSASAMAPPPPPPQPPTRKAAKLGAKKTHETLTFLARGARAQSQAIASGSRIPYVSCNCGQRSCNICKSQKSDPLIVFL